MSDAGAERPGAAALEAEELARANLYGVVSRLFYAPPDAGLLAEVSNGAGDAGGPDCGEADLAHAWRDLQEACRAADPAGVRQEYDGLFVGVGKAAVTPYLSAYAEPQSPERYLVRLREQLGAWGLARRDGSFETEDHMSGVSDVMRWLITDGRPLHEQRGFFEDFVHSGAVAFLVALQECPAASFYRGVAQFTLEFLEIENLAFEMD